MRTHRAALVLGIAAGLLSIPTHATPITPGEVVTGSPVTVTQVGSALASNSGTITARTYTATYAESVIHDASNPYNATCGGSGCLTFLFQVTNLAGSPNGIEHVTDGDGGSGFLNNSNSVGYVAGAGRFPVTVTETTYGTLSFDFTGSDVLHPGTTTDTLVVETNATTYLTGLFSVIDSSTGTVDGFVPLENVVTPEPASLALLGTGLLGLVGLRRRRSSMA